MQPRNLSGQLQEWSAPPRKRTIEEAVLRVGETWENDKFRVHRYASSLVVTDLTNAGKRGKKVDEFALYGLDMRLLPQEGIVDEIMMLVQRGDGWNRILQAAKEAEVLGAGLEVRSPRGIDVLPGGTKPVELKTPSLWIRSDPKDFLVRDLRDTINEPTLIPPTSGAKTAATKFYAWIKDNQDKIKSLDFRGIQKAMSSAGIGYHYYLAMD